jgi:hypothetical protein
VGVGVGGGGGGGGGWAGRRRRESGRERVRSVGVRSRPKVEHVLKVDARLREHSEAERPQDLSEDDGEAGAEEGQLRRLPRRRAAVEPFDLCIDENVPQEPHEEGKADAGAETERDKQQ